jgi:hypothetical protein
MTQEITDTHRRAALRGREAVAQSRITGAVWAGRIYTILFVVLSIVPLLRRGGPDWASTVVLLLFAAGLLYATERMRRGSRAAAVVLLVLFVATKLADWLLAHAPLYSGALWTIIILGALVNGVWGTFALARVRREAALVPPAPPRGERATPAV